MAEVVKPGQAQNTVTGSTSTSGSVGIGSFTNYTFADDSMSMSSSDNTKVVDLKDLRDLMSTVLDLPLDEINESFPSSSSTGFTKCPDVDRIEGIVGTVFTNNDDKFENLTFSNDSQLAPNQLVDRGHCKFNFTKIEVNTKDKYFSTINVNFIKTLKPSQGTYEYEKFTWNHIRLTIDCYSQNSDGSLEKCGNYQIIGNTGNKEQWWVLNEHTESSDLFTLTFPTGESDFNKTNPIVLSKESTEESIVTLQLTTQRRDIDAIQIKMDAYTSDLNPKYMYDADHIALGEWMYTYKMGMDKANLYDCDAETYLLKDNIEVEHPENVYLTPSSPGQNTLNMYIGYEFLEHEIQQNESVFLDVMVLQYFEEDPIVDNSYHYLHVSINQQEGQMSGPSLQLGDKYWRNVTYTTDKNTPVFKFAPGSKISRETISFSADVDLKNVVWEQITDINDEVLKTQYINVNNILQNRYLLNNIDSTNVGFGPDGKHPLLVLKIINHFNWQGTLYQQVETGDTYSYQIEILNPYTKDSSFTEYSVLYDSGQKAEDAYKNMIFHISTDTVNDGDSKEYETRDVPTYGRPVFIYTRKNTPTLFYRLPRTDITIGDKTYIYPDIPWIELTGKKNEYVISTIYWADAMSVSIDLTIKIGVSHINSIIEIYPFLKLSGKIFDLTSHSELFDKMNNRIRVQVPNEVGDVYTVRLTLFANNLDYHNEGYILCFNTPNGDGGFDGLDYESDGNVYDPSINSYDKFYSRDPGLIQKDVTLNIDYDK